MKNFILFLALCISFSASGDNTRPPAPYGAIPTPQQVLWQQMEYYMFIHFGPNTFTDQEWGHGNENPQIFNPFDLDCRQWAKIAKEAGMKAIIITAKHHDGFCLWPSLYSTHTVRESAWQDGKGDLLKDLSEACREYGLQFGVYLSPWDRNHPTYGTDDYNQVFANTLKEVLGNYGLIFEQWFDGANGEGANGKKQIYDWNLFANVVHSLQPDALIFGSPMRNIRWVGNESGYAGKTNWATFSPDNTIDGSIYGDVLGSGTENGKEWLPAEVDVSIRPGWFYSPSTNNSVKSLNKLVDIYNSSVGRNSNLLLNVPPDQRGLIHPHDSTRLMELKKYLDAAFSVNLAKGASISADNVRGKSSEYSASLLLDDNFDTYWATDDEITSAVIDISMTEKTTFNRIVLQEYIPLGQRVKSFSVEYWNDKEWVLIDKQTTIGYKRILDFAPVTAQKVRLRIENALACPVLNGIGIYKAPELLTVPEISRTKEGKVQIQCESSDPVIYYTLDGTEPTIASKQYTQNFNFSKGGNICAKAFINHNQQSSETVCIDYDIAPAKWSIMDLQTTEASKIIDADPQTVYVIPQNQNPVISINLGQKILLKGFSYTPDPKSQGNIYRYNFYVSNDGKTWNKVTNNATFDNIKNNPITQKVRFEKPVKATYIRLESIETVEPGQGVAVGEIGVITW